MRRAVSTIGVCSDHGGHKHVLDRFWRVPWGWYVQQIGLQHASPLWHW